MPSAPINLPGAGPEGAVPFYDVHTHRSGPSPGVVPILNLTQPYFHAAPENAFFSAGLHPWFLAEENLESDYKILERLAGSKNLEAVGECGLDRLRGAPLDFQTAALERQIRLADQIGKPVVIHCVKAFSELIAVRKKLSPDVPLIIHGFNQNLHILASTLDAGFYISVGAALLRADSNAVRALPLIPADRLFFETDDSGANIEDIYYQAAALLNIKTGDLKSIIHRNFMRLFE